MSPCGHGTPVRCPTVFWAPHSPGMPYGLAPMAGGWWGVASRCPLSTFTFCQLVATSSSERLLRGFYPLFFPKFFL